MSFTNNLETYQKELKYVGYESVREPFDISSLKKECSVIDCEIIAKKDFYNILYMEVQSNWREIATDVAKKNQNPCLVITKYRGTHIILSTMRDHTTLHAKPRYVVIDTTSKTHSMKDFIKLIKTSKNDNDTIIEIVEKIHNAFDEFSEYKEAHIEFAKNLETIIEKTEAMIEAAIFKNERYDTEAKKLLDMCQKVINDKMIMDDIKDMLLQHILTYKIFTMVYAESNFHQNNTIAKSIESLRSLLNITDDAIDYKTMSIIAESITDSDQKQEFLKKIYETFYQKHNKAKSDKDGIVYTPTEVINFMVSSTDQLLKKHFKRNISDDNVTILDPATGTGTFLVHILRQINVNKLEQKYVKEIHANELSILPYYIATLNIEYTYKELTGKYKEFENICWMDTLDSDRKNYEKLTAYFDDDNIKRISRQQKAKIHIIIGNPPYRASQKNANDANPSDSYPHIDSKIREDYLKTSNVKKHKSRDPYKRFLKWSSERIKKNGIVAFVSNNSFLDAKADDGMRRALYNEFDYIYTVNLKGNTRLPGEAWRKEGGKIFGCRSHVGVAITFFIKTSEGHSEIQYAEIDDYVTRDNKLKWLKQHTLSTLKLTEIIPDKNATWLNQVDNDFDELVPVLPKETQESIFQTATMGTNAAKDGWVYDFDKKNLKEKMRFYIHAYNNTLKIYKSINPKPENLITWVDKKIKWTRITWSYLKQKFDMIYSDDKIIQTLYRPFIIKHQYYDYGIIQDMRDFTNIFTNSYKNLLIGFPNPKTNGVFNTIGSNLVTCLDLIGGTQNIPLWKYHNGKKYSNITKYGLDLFRQNYKNPNITDVDIFYYTYAIFNDPKYEKKYINNLQREFPRIPLAKNFKKWVTIGKILFNIHCDFNNVKEYPLKRTDKNTTKNITRLSFKNDKVIKIIIDDITTLEHIPKDVLDYTFKSKNPLEIILDFYKESKNKMDAKLSDDENIRKKFNTYKFDDHKEDVIKILRRVTTVCVETVKLRKELQMLEWGEQPKLNFTKIYKNTKINSTPSNMHKIKKNTERKKKKIIINPNDTNIDAY